MTRILLTALLGLSCYWAKADFYYQNSIYINCAGCSSNSAYSAAARNHFTNSLSQPTVQQRYVVRGMANIKAVNVFRNIREDEYVRFPRYPIEPIEPTQPRITTFISNVTAQERAFYDDYVTPMVWYLEPWYILEPEEIKKKPNLLELDRVPFNFYPEVGITNNIRDEINRLLFLKEDFNPFLFAESKAKVKFSSANGYTLYAYNFNLSSTHDWKVALYYDSEQEQVFDSNSNPINYVDTLPNGADCLHGYEFKVCMKYHNSIGYYGDYFSLPFFRRPGPIRPPSCLPGQTCNSGE